jgi:hypothetical protein
MRYTWPHVTSAHKTVIPERPPLISAKVNIDPADMRLFPYSYTKRYI